MSCVIMVPTCHEAVSPVSIGHPIKSSTTAKSSSGPVFLEEGQTQQLDIKRQKEQRS